MDRLLEDPKRPLLSCAQFFEGTFVPGRLAGRLAWHFILGLPMTIIGTVLNIKGE